MTNQKDEFGVQQRSQYLGKASLIFFLSKLSYNLLSISSFIYNVMGHALFVKYIHVDSYLKIMKIFLNKEN